MFSTKLLQKLDPSTQVLIINCTKLTSKLQNVDLCLGYDSKASKVEASGYEEPEPGTFSSYFRE